MKKSLRILYAGGALALALSACGHEHTLVFHTADLNDHSHTCTECGEIVSEAHTLNEDQFCEDCGLSVYDQGDSWYNLVSYDDHGGIRSDSFYDEAGDLQSEMIYESEYDEDGNETYCRTYSDDVLIHEVYYVTLEGDNYFNHYIDREISYDGDTKTMTVYDQSMNPSSIYVMDLSDNVITETTYEYELDEEGNVLHCICCVDGVMIGEYKDFVDSRGNVRREYEKEYEDSQLTRNLSYEYDFSEDGALMGEREFINGSLTREARYELDQDGWEYLAVEIYYDENGVMEEYHYDAGGNMIE